MGINRYFTAAQIPTGQEYFKLPFNELYTALGAKQKQQDEARAKNAELQAEADKVKALQPDQEEAFAINQKFKDSIDKLSNQDLTGPEGKIATRALLQMGREYFGPNGRATAINNNYNTRALYEKKVDEYIKANKDVDPAYKLAAMNHFDKDYETKGGIGQLNSNKSYNKYDSEDLAYLNVDDVVEKAVEGNISDSYDTSVENPDNKGYFLKKGTKNEWVKYEDILQQAYEKVLADPAIGSHIKQGIKFGYYGKDDFDIKNAITTTKDANGNIIHTPNNRLGLIGDRAARKKGFSKYAYNQDVTSDATFLHNDDKEDKSVALPVYASPNGEIKPVFKGDEFKIQSKGLPVAKTESEKQAIRNRYYVNGKEPIGPSLVTMYAELEGKNTRKEDGYTPLKELPDAKRGTALSILKLTNKYTQDEIKALENGTASKEKTKEAYALLDKYSQTLSKNILVNNDVITMTPDDAKNTNRQIFGSETGITVKDLGTAEGKDLTVYDKETGKKYKWKDFIKVIQKDLPEDANISIQGRYSPKNTFEYLTGSEGRFKNPYSLSVGGKEYALSGPKTFTGPNGIETKKSQEMNQIKYGNDVLNSIYNSTFTGIGSIHDNSIIHVESPNGEEQFIIKDKLNNTIVSASSAEEASNEYIKYQILHAGR